MLVRTDLASREYLRYLLVATDWPSRSKTEQLLRTAGRTGTVEETCPTNMKNFVSGKFVARVVLRLDVGPRPGPSPHAPVAAP